MNPEGAVGHSVQPGRCELNPERERKAWELSESGWPRESEGRSRRGEAGERDCSACSLCRRALHCDCGASHDPEEKLRVVTRPRSHS